MTTISDADLVDAFLSQGQDTAFVELVRRHQIPVYRKLAVDLADPDDAEAVCEAAFVVASRRLGEWSKQGDLRDWLLTVATEVGNSRHGEAADTQSPRFVDPAVFFRHSVHRALHALTPEQRTVLVAVDLEGQSLEDLAQAQSAPIERVTQALEQARTRFTEAINEKPAGAPGSESGPTPTRVAPGEIIDNRYRVEELLGQGGMATVFRAEHLGIKRKVALKTLRPTRQTQAMIRERFTREAEVLGRLAHPNFVDVSDFGESARGLAYLVMELLDGHPLSAEIRDQGKLSPGRALSILRQVCKGVQFAHEIGIIHRDIKPDNVVILEEETADGFAKILDLGIAATAEQADLEEGALYGTPAYMAPEQITGSRIDGRVDLYAMGIMLFEMLTGQVPFQGGTIQFVLAQQLTAAPPRLADATEGLPEVDALQHLLDLCLAKDPAQRVKSARALEQEIDVVLAQLGDDAPGAGASRLAPPTHVVATQKSAPARRSRAWLWLLVVLGAAATIAWWLAKRASL